MDSYAVASKIYARTLDPLNAPLRRTARRLCPTDPSWVVLDVGCGPGAALAEYAAEGCTVIGADTSPAMLGQARNALGAEADLRHVTGETVPVQDDAADLVVISLVLHSLARDEAVGLLAEATRVLAPGGRILVTDFNTAGLSFPRGHLTRALTAFAEVAAGPRHAANAGAYLRSGGLPALAERAGLDTTAQRPAAGGNIVLAVLQPSPAPSSAAGTTD